MLFDCFTNSLVFGDKDKSALNTEEKKKARKADCNFVFQRSKQVTKFNVSPER